MYFLRTSYNLYKIKFSYFLETQWWWSDIPTSHVLELLNKSSWFVNIKSMHVGFVDWKYVRDEMRLFRLKRFSNSSKCLFSIVKSKSPVNKTLPYFVENSFIDRLHLWIL